MDFTTSPSTSEFFDKIMTLSFHVPHDYKKSTESPHQNLREFASENRTPINIRAAIFEQGQLFSHFSHQGKIEVDNFQALAFAHVNQNPTKRINDHAVTDVNVFHLVGSDHIATIFQRPRPHHGCQCSTFMSPCTQPEGETSISAPINVRSRDNSGKRR